MSSTTVPSVRDRVLAAATDLLDRGGRDALSTRSVAAAAGVQAPAIYRHFGDKQGLLDAVAARGFADYLESKRALRPAGDPLDLLREGWDLHIAFGLSKPAFYLLIYGEPRPDGLPVARQAEELLRAGFVRLAEAGRLRLGIDRAVALMQAAGVGLVLTLLARPEKERDEGLSPLIRELVLSASVTDAGSATTGIDPALVALRHTLRAGDNDRTAALTAPERLLMTQWIDRLERADS